jgi:hypothetical protein
MSALHRLKSPALSRFSSALDVLSECDTCARRGEPPQPMNMTDGQELIARLDALGLSISEPPTVTDDPEIGKVVRRTAELREHWALTTADAERRRREHHWEAAA